MILDLDYVKILQKEQTCVAVSNYMLVSRALMASFTARRANKRISCQKSFELCNAQSQDCFSWPFDKERMKRLLLDGFSTEHDRRRHLHPDAKVQRPEPVCRVHRGRCLETRMTLTLIDVRPNVETRGVLGQAATELRCNSALVVCHLHHGSLCALHQEQCST